MSLADKKLKKLVNQNLVCIIFIYLFKNKLFIYFWLHWVFVPVRRLSLVVASGGYCFVAVRRLLIAVASLVVEHGL